MSIDEVFLHRRKRWDSLIQNRKYPQDTEVTCPKCNETYPSGAIRENIYRCPNCDHYFSMNPKNRIRLIYDEGSFKELFSELKTDNPINFPEYEEKIDSIIEKTGKNDAFITGVCSIAGIKVAIGVSDTRFLMGSMGTVVGEKIVRLTEYAEKKKLPLILFSASGGARMQEGLFSLMQMAKTSAAIERFKEKGGLFISILTNPTTGGVSASYASLGDIIIAEPDALIGFAGPRVIEQTIGQKLPKEFQHAEFLLEHGMVDLIVERPDLRDTLSKILRIHM